MSSKIFSNGRPLHIFPEFDDYRVKKRKLTVDLFNIKVYVTQKYSCLSPVLSQWKSSKIDKETSGSLIIKNNIPSAGTSCTLFLINQWPALQNTAVLCNF